MTVQEAPLRQDRHGPLPPRRSPAATRSLSLRTITAALGFVGLAFVLTVVGFVSWNEHRTIMREARDHAQSAASYLADHANRLFEVSDVALRTAALTIGTKDWDTVESSQTLWTTLHDTASFSPYIDDIWLNDANGRLRLTSFAFPAPFSDATNREVFQRIKAGDRGLVVGERVVGTLTKKATFLVARRLDTPEGHFRGMVSVTLDLSYFPAYWSSLDLPNEERISFVRAQQGDVLTSYQKPGSVDRTAFDPSSFLAGLAKAPLKGEFEPSPDLFGFYHRIGAIPLYVIVEFTRSSVLLVWWAWMARLLPLAVLVFAMLVAMTITGSRQARRDAQAARDLEAARKALADVNQTLERRVVERTAELQESSEEIQRFVYIVSHDLRAPLVNIMGFTQELQGLRPLLFSRPSSGDDVRSAGSLDAACEEFDEAIGFIRTSSAKMDRLISAILSLSRQGKRKFQPEPIDLSTFIQSIADAMAHNAQRAGALVTVGALPSIHCDRLALDQIFSNLIDNALKYLRPDCPGRVEISGERSGRWIVVAIQDNGRGIDAGDHERVFDLFRRAGSQDQPGEGIGLAYVRGQVKRLGGTIELESMPGRGSRFIVHLPEMGPPDSTTDL